jgi:hypothetical protein
MMRRNIILLAALQISIAIPGRGQETMFAVLKPDLKLANEYFESKNYHQALNLFYDIAARDAQADIYLKIARCHYFLKQYPQTVSAYDRYIGIQGALPGKENYLHAEALAACGNYQQAVEFYKRHLLVVPGDQTTERKIWRLTNIQYLYEDSLHFAVRPVAFNTTYAELCPVMFRKGLMFMSNRKEVNMIEKIDGSINASFYRVYYSSSLDDSSGIVQFDKPFLSKGIKSRFHAGPLSFYQKGSRLVFASNANNSSDKGTRALALYFAEEYQGTWRVTSSFPYNDPDHSITDPAISEDGTTLYFSSDMKGGYGGRDLYRSQFLNGKWTRPENLGDNINTAYDEVFPYLHQGKTLYFSSNGHAGMGALDIFKTAIGQQGFQEPQNAGYPLNSSADDFGIVIDSLQTRGYFSSNRKNGGFDDDIYEFDMDLQTYPVQISGHIRYKEHNWSDSSTLKIFPDAKLFLVDHDRNVQVYEGVSDGAGNFTIIIPYFSKYKIRVVGEDGEEHIVSLEIPKHKKHYSNYEIVIVRDAFKSKENQLVK